MYILKLTLFWLLTTLVSGIPTGNSVKPPASALQSATIRVPIEKRGFQALSSNGVANIALYQQQLNKTLAKISRGSKQFKVNTGVSLQAMLAEVSKDLGLNPIVDAVLNDVVDPILNPIIGTISKVLAPILESLDPVSLESNKSLSQRDGSTSLTDDSNVLWHGTIQVGTPPTNFTVDFDTGSSDLFLPGVNCTACQGHTIYDTQDSSTAVPLNKEFDLEYGDGSTVSGLQYNDTVTLSGISVNSQTLGVASTYSGFSVDEFPPDGLLGMGFETISAYPAAPLFQNMVTLGLVSTPEFSFKLSDTPGDSELTIGGSNPDLFDSDSLVSVNVTVAGYWQVVIDGVNVDGQAAATKFSGIVDTGTTLLIGDAQTVNATYSLIPGAKDASQTIGAGYFTYPCNTTSVVSLTFGGTQFNISQEVFNLGQVSESDLEDCVGGLVASDTGIGWIIGDIFLRNTYTIFNFGSQTVGFANLNSL